MSDRKHLHIGYNMLTDGAHNAAWRASGSDPVGAYDPAQWALLAKTAERGTLDALFLADTLTVSGSATEDGPGWAPYDPTVLLANLAAVTERIGLVATVSTSYEEPFNIARRFASLDHLSRGRIGWNVITGFDPTVAANFRAEAHPSRESRYARAEEFVDVVTALWESWDDDALVADPATGVFARPGAVRAIDHAGEYFSVRGPLTLPQTPQGRPVLLQAGGSERGLELAARTAEAVFSSAPSLVAAQRYYADLKRRVVAHGRHPDALKVLPGLTTIIGGTEEEARQRWNDLEELTGEGSELWLLALSAGLDPSEVDLDAELPITLLEQRRDAWQGSLGFYDALIAAARTEPAPLRELLDRFSGHRRIIGAPEQVADLMEEWFRQGGADGFIVMPDVNPSGLETFVDHVVPILRRRGIFRHEYEGSTLRDHLGLDRPVNRRLASVAPSRPAEPAPASLAA